MRYAIALKATGNGPKTMVFGHRHKHAWFACGHMINDSHTVEEVGGADNYRRLANGNCEPVSCLGGSIVMMTKRDITKGEELLYNYGAARWVAETSMPHAPEDPAGEVTKRMGGLSVWWEG